MSKVAIKGADTGTGVFTLESPATNTDRTLTIPDVDGSIVAADASGNVGVGTDAPSSFLHLVKADATAYSATATDGQVGVGPTIYLENPTNANDTVGGQIVFGMRSTEEQVRIGATGGTSPALTFGTADAERMRVTSDGLDIAGLLAINGITTKQIIGVYSDADSTDYTRTTTTDGAFGALLTINPVSASSSFLIVATMTGDVDQTGTDNDAAAVLTACNRTSNGTYSNGWNTQSVNLGTVNGGTGLHPFAQITVIQRLDSASDRYGGNIVVRHWGSLSVDTTSGWAATLHARNLSIIAVEYI